MSEFILFLVIAALCALIGYDRHENRRERQKFIQALMSKTAQDLKDFELTEKIQIVKEEPQINPEMTAVEDLDEKDFVKYVMGDQRG